MKIYFEVPYGHDVPKVVGDLKFLPRRGDFVAVYKPKWHEVVMLRVQKIWFDYDLFCVTIVLVEEE